MSRESFYPYNRGSSSSSSRDNRNYDRYHDYRDRDSYNARKEKEYRARDERDHNYKRGHSNSRHDQIDKGRREDDRRSSNHSNNNFASRDRETFKNKEKKNSRIDENDSSCLYSQQLNHLFGKNGPSVITIATPLFEAAVKENQATVFVFQNYMRVLSEQSVDKKTADELFGIARDTWKLANEKQNVVNYRILSSYLYVAVTAEKYEEAIQAYDEFTWPDNPNEFESQKFAKAVFIKSFNMTAFHYMLAHTKKNNFVNAKNFFEKMIKHTLLTLETKDKIARLYFELCREELKYSELDSILEQLIENRVVTSDSFLLYLELSVLSSPNELNEKVLSNFWRVVKLYYEKKFKDEYVKDFTKTYRVVVKWIAHADLNKIYDFWRNCQNYLKGIIYRFFLSIVTELINLNTDDSYAMAKKIFIENTSNLLSQQFETFHVLMQQALIRKDVELARKIYLKISEKNTFEKNKNDVSKNIKKIHNMFLNVVVNCNNGVTGQYNPDEIFKSIVTKDALGYASYGWHLLREKRYFDVDRNFNNASMKDCLSPELYTSYLLYLLHKSNLEANAVEDFEEGELVDTPHVFKEIFTQIENNKCLNSDHIKLLILTAESWHMKYIEDKILLAKEKKIWSQDCGNLFDQFKQQCKNKGVLPLKRFDEVMLIINPFDVEKIKAEVKKHISKYNKSKPDDEQKQRLNEPKEKIISSSPTRSDSSSFATSMTQSSSRLVVTSNNNMQPQTILLDNDDVQDDPKEEGEVPSAKNENKKKTKKRKAYVQPGKHGPAKKRKTEVTTNNNNNNIVEKEQHEKTDILDEGIPDDFDFLNESSAPVEQQLPNVTSVQKQVAEDQSSKTKKTAKELSQFFQLASNQVPFSPKADPQTDEDEETTYSHSHEEEICYEDLFLSIEDIHVFIIENKEKKWTNAEWALELFKRYGLEGADDELNQRFYKKAGHDAINGFFNEINSDIENESDRLSLARLKKMAQEVARGKYQNYSHKKKIYSKEDEKADEDEIFINEMGNKGEVLKSTTSKDRKIRTRSYA